MMLSDNSVIDAREDAKAQTIWDDTGYFASGVVDAREDAKAQKIFG